MLESEQAAIDERTRACSEEIGQADIVVGVPGYVRHTYICVVTPSTGDASVESAGLSVEFRGPKHFRQTRKNAPPGVGRTFKFLSFPVGAYEVIVKYGHRPITESVELIDDCIEIEVEFE